MTTRTIDASTAALEDVAEEVARVVFAGGTVILPNDTSYLIGCDPYASEAIDRIYAAKGRPDNRPLTMHVANAQEFLEYAPENPLASYAAKRLLPAPVILLIRKPAFISDELAAGLQTLAFRVPDDPFARALLERCGPVAGTTANPRGGPRYLGGDDRSMLPPADLWSRTDRRATIANRPSSISPAFTRASCGRGSSPKGASRNSSGRSNVLR